MTSEKVSGVIFFVTYFTAIEMCLSQAEIIYAISCSTQIICIYFYLTIKYEISTILL